MIKTSEGQRLRARLAQQKSRAKRRTTFEHLQARGQILTRAVDELLENSLRFSDVVVSFVDLCKCQSLYESLQEFVSKALAVAQTAMEYDGEMDDMPLAPISQEHATPKHVAAEAPTVSHETSTAAETIRVKPPQRSPPVAVMPYGVLPSLSGCLSPPYDVIDSLSPAVAPFGAMLYWNSLAFARIALNYPSARVTQSIFEHVIPFSGADRQRKQINRRLAFRPHSVPLLIAVPNTFDEMINENDHINVKLEEEAMERDYEEVPRAMLLSADSVSSYLSPAEVDTRFSDIWGIDTALLFATAVKMGPIGGLSQFVTAFVQTGVCLGNKPGFPISVVDAAASYILQNHTPK